jgi:hypothetical protein
LNIFCYQTLHIMHIDLAQIEDVHLMKNDSILIDDIHLLLVF